MFSRIGSVISETVYVEFNIMQCSSCWQLASSGSNWQIKNEIATVLTNLALQRAVISFTAMAVHIIAISLLEQRRNRERCQICDYYSSLPLM